MGSREQEQADEMQGDQVTKDMADRDTPESDVEPREIEFADHVDIIGDLTGLFNTFRIGMKWADAKPLEELDLVVTSKDNPEDRRTLAGMVVVMSVHHGTLGDMLDLHVGLNHGCVQPMFADRKTELHGVLERVYGRRLGLGEKCVVLYIARMV